MSADSGNYRYATVLRALNDGKPPNDNIKEGDKILQAGKEDGYVLRYLADDHELATVRFETVEVLDTGEAKYTEDGIIDWCREYFAEEAVGGNQ